MAQSVDGCMDYWHDGLCLYGQHQNTITNRIYSITFATTAYRYMMMEHTAIRLNFHFICLSDYITSIIMGEKITSDVYTQQNWICFYSLDTMTIGHTIQHHLIVHQELQAVFYNQMPFFQLFAMYFKQHKVSIFDALNLSMSAYHWNFCFF